jgi:type I restriction enzyme M protein
LIFLKQISGKFDERRQFLEDTDDDVDDKDAYTEVCVVFVPPSAHWSLMSKAAHTERIGVVIDDAIKAVEQENKWLKNAMLKNYARQEFDKIRLGNVVDLITNMKKSDQEDMLVRAYGFFLSKFTELEGNRTGEFCTPPCVINLMLEILKPLRGRVYDPCCGTCGMFVQLFDFVKRNSGDMRNLSLYGQEVNRDTRNMAVMNIAIRGIEANLGEKEADTFYNDLHSDRKMHYILANPPFNLRWNDGTLDMDPRWKYGLPPSGCSNFAWVQHMIDHLVPNGKIGLVMANVALFSRAESDIRKNIVKADLVEGIIALPGDMFRETKIPVAIWFINCNKKQKNKTLFIDARKMGTMVNHVLREMTAAEISKIVATFDAFKAGTLENAKGFCAVATTEEIASKNYILTPARYVDIEEQDDDDEFFDDKMTRLAGEFSELRKLTIEMDDRIQNLLESIGYDI